MAYDAKQHDPHGLGLVIALILSASTWLAPTALPALAKDLAPATSPAPVATAEPPGSQPGDELVEPLRPLHPRSEKEEDALHSLGLFAAARSAEHEGNFPAALAHYQRAFRYDPENIEALRRIAELSEALGQPTVAACYDSYLAAREMVEPIDLLRAVIYLREAGHADRALAAYENGVAQRDGATRSPAWVELHKLAGEMYLRAEKFDKAADALAQVDDALQRPRAYGLSTESLKLIQDDSDPLLLTIADAMLRAGRDSEAASVFQRAAKISGDRGVLLFGLARIAAASKHYDEALENLDLYLDQRLTSQEEAPYRLLADVLGKQKQSDALLGRLQRAAAADGSNEPLGRFLAAQYVAAGKLPPARQLYEKLLARKPTTALYRGLIRVLCQASEPAALLNALGKALGPTGALSVLGDQSVAISGNAKLLTALIAEADRRLKSDPGGLKFGPRLAVALLAAEGKQFEVAEQYFELAIKAEPGQKGTLLSTWGFALLAGDRFADSARVFQRALDEHAISVDNAALQYYLAGALAMAGRHDDALAAARKAAAGPTPAPEYLIRVAWVQYRAKRYDEAKRAYADVIKRFDMEHAAPGARDVVREARLTLANLHVLTGKLPEAEELIEQVLDESPDNAGALNDLAYLWADRGKHLQRAVAMLREAVAAEPDNFAYHDSLGWALFRLVRTEEALKELRRAAAAKEPDGVVLDHLGDVLEKSGRRSEALKTWRLAVAALDKQQESAKRKATQAKIDRAERATATGLPK